MQLKQELMMAFPGTDLVKLDEAVSDYQLGLSLLEATFSAKTRCWTCLPWRAAGLAVADEAAARHLAEQILAEYDIMQNHLDENAVQTGITHRLTQAWFRAGAPVRVDLERFIAGRPRLLCPNLKELIARFLFLPCAERIQEGDHARISQKAPKRKVGPFLRTVFLHGSLFLESANRVSVVHCVITTSLQLRNFGMHHLYGALDQHAVTAPF